MEVMWAYDEYSEWARRLALSYCAKELAGRLARVERQQERAKDAHLRAVQRTHSMASQSQQRAQTRNAMVGAYEEATALRNALEIHQHFPEHAKPTASA